MGIWRTDVEKARCILPARRANSDCGVLVLRSGTSGATRPPLDAWAREVRASTSASAADRGFECCVWFWTEISARSADTESSSLFPGEPKGSEQPSEGEDPGRAVEEVEENEPDEDEPSDSIRILRLTAACRFRWRSMRLWEMGWGAPGDEFLWASAMSPCGSPGDPGGRTTKAAVPRGLPPTEEWEEEEEREDAAPWEAREDEVKDEVGDENEFGDENELAAGKGGAPDVVADLGISMGPEAWGRPILALPAAGEDSHAGE